MSPDDSIFLPTTGEDESFLLSAKITLSSPPKPERIEQSAASNEVNQGTFRKSKRSSGLEDGRRRTAELVARLQQEREQRQARAKPSALRANTAQHQDREDELEWEDIKQVTENAALSTGPPSEEVKTTAKERTHSSADTSLSREESIVALKQRIAEARAKRQPVTSDRAGQPEKTSISAGPSGLRNNAFAKIMNRPERTKVTQPAVPVKASPMEQEQSRDRAADGIQRTVSDPPAKTSKVAPHGLEIDRGNRMIEKLMGSAPKSQAWRAAPQETSSLAVEPIEPNSMSPAPTSAPTAQSKPMMVLERIEETLREELNTTVEGTSSILVQETPALVHSSTVAVPEVTELHEPVGLSLNPEPENEETTTAESMVPIGISGAASDVASIDPGAIPIDSLAVATDPDYDHDANPSLPHTPVRNIPEADQSEISIPGVAALSNRSEKLEHEWVDEEPLAFVPVSNVAPANNNLQSIFPISMNNARLARMLLPVQAQAGPSSTNRAPSNIAVQNLSRFPQTTLPRTPTFARAKRRVAKDSPVKRVLKSRSTAQPAPRPVYRSKPRQREEAVALASTDVQPRPALANMSLLGHNVASRNKPSLPVVEGIARKPSSIVQIPDFGKAHKAVESKTKRVQTRITRPEPGRTPGRTSRARMMERAEFDKANRDYQARREEALRRYKQEKEEAAWAAEMELRNAIAFKANPVPDFIRATRS